MAQPIPYNQVHRLALAASHCATIDMQRGWWRLSNPDTVKELMASLNMRGVRERLLQKALERQLDYINQLSTKQKKNCKKCSSRMAFFPKLCVTG